MFGSKRLWWSVPALAGLALLFSAGCARDAGRPTAPGAGGRIEGVLLGGTRPVAALVRAVPLSAAPSDSGAGTYAARADSGGRYRLDLPPGRYLVNAQAAGVRLWYAFGYPGDLAYAETLEVVQDPVTADFRAGSLALDVSTSSSLDGRRLTLRAERAPGRDGVAAGPQEAVVSAGQAQFAFPWMAPGTYLLWMGTVEGSGFYLDGVFGRDGALRQGISPGRDAERHFLLEPPAVVHGQVTGSWLSMPVLPPRIEAYAEGLGRIAWTTASSEGDFALESFVSGPVRLRVVIGQVPRWIGGRSFTDALEFYLRRGEDLRAPDYQESGILAHLDYPEGTSPDSIRILLADSLGIPVALEAGLLPGAGPLCLANLPPGSYIVGISPRGASSSWCDQWYDGALDEDRAVRIRLGGPGRLVSITLSYRRALCPGAARRVGAAAGPGSW